MLAQARHSQSPVQMAVLGMTPEIWVAGQVLASLAQGLIKTEEAWRDDTLPEEIADKALALARLFVRKMG